MIASSEMCRLRKDDRIFTTKATWKVTARYTLWTSKTKRIQCVRVSSNYNGGSQTPAVVLHLSEAEYMRLFVPLKERTGPR